MPEFKDSRKQVTSNVFNGWVDDNEPASPIADLFRKVMPLMRRLKRSGSLRFPPPPPHEELPHSPDSINVSVLARQAASIEGLDKDEAKAVAVTSTGAAPALMSISDDKDGSSVSANFFENKVLSKFVGWLRPELTDYAREKRSFVAVDPAVVGELASSVRHRFEADKLRPEPPLLIEDSDHFTAVLREHSSQLIAVYFFAPWCNPCKSLSRVVHQLSTKIPTVRFLKVRN